ncbi:COX15-CtaA-domain-containing protein [Polychaeton citri CBS 116435]|uniref:COX15-CtaA-domain-containing protein n=1 Tax=Polychaeton citri CBS 116435 TaxID=1314669 RepID=A0A9P4UL02_9PEZI|nr:COX15-CtaA-domain-containing protein [Polychaeton citri CBS 116435]
MATLFAQSPIRARLAVKASNYLQEAYVCRRCLHKQTNAQATHIARTYRSTQQTPFLSAFRQPRQHNAIRSSSSAAADAPHASPLGELSQKLVKPVNVHSSKTSSFPDTSSKSVAYWLLGSAASVFGIVVFGGLTRLTESGLSITEWRPVTGSFPPRDQQAWEEEFARYKLSPEFKMLNSRMTVEEFKQIYWMEWIHRLWGRVVGMTMVVPTVYFVARRRVSKTMALRITGICGLIGFQGFLGWWMVKSGLKDDLFAPGSHPRVSQYRLAAHLGTAFVAYIAMLWNGLAILQQHRLLGDTAKASKFFSQLQSPSVRSFSRIHAAISMLIFTTVISGAFVAGLDAGLIYNDFPWMGQGLLPPKTEMLDTFYSHQPPPHSDLVWRNMLENPVLVQLDHRVLATTTYCAVSVFWAWSKYGPSIRAALPRTLARPTLAMLGLVNLQVALGITTLWYLVPTPLAAMHQAGALLLLTGATVLGSRIWIPRQTLKVVRQAISRAQRAPLPADPGAMLKARLGR